MTRLGIDDKCSCLGGLSNALEGMAEQHRIDHCGGGIDSRALSTNVYVIGDLAKHGLIEIPQSYGRNITGDWVES